MKHSDGRQETPFKPSRGNRGSILLGRTSKIKDLLVSATGVSNKCPILRARKTVVYHQLTIR